MRTHEIVEISLERLPDGSIKVRAVNQGTGRVLFDPVYVSESGVAECVVRVTPAGVMYELKGAGHGKNLTA